MTKIERIGLGIPLIILLLYSNARNLITFPHLSNEKLSKLFTSLSNVYLTNENYEIIMTLCDIFCSENKKFE
jgi:hypothetical protein